MNTKSPRRETVLRWAIMCAISASNLHVSAQVIFEEKREISIEVHEGTELAFDLSPDGKTIVFDLLGQLWLLPSEGGEARAITNSIQETSEHLYPTFTFDGNRIVFWEARSSSWGLSSMDLYGGERRTLTELFSSKDDSYNDRFFACSPVKPQVVFTRDGKLMLIRDEERKTPEELTLEGLPHLGITDPTFTPDGNKVAFINASANVSYFYHFGGRLWQVRAEGGNADSLGDGDIEIRAPRYSPDGQCIAYFVRNEDLDFELWASNSDGDEARKLTAHKDITPLRLRWFPDGKDLIYCAEGRFWKVPVRGGQSQEIPFTARLSISQDQPELKSVQFPKPQQSRTAHGHMGLAISPDGKKIAAIALSRLWVWDVGTKPTAVAKLPLSASGLCWSPFNNEVAWSAGISGSEDLFATNVQSGLTRRLIAIPGTEVRASWSPDGEYIAFVYRKNMDVIRKEFDSKSADMKSYESLRALKVSEAPVTEIAQTLELQTYPWYGQSLILSQNRHWGLPWSSDSKCLLGESAGKPALVSLEGKVIPLQDSRKYPLGAVPFWEATGSLLFGANFLLWQSPFDTLTGMNAEPVPLSQDAALYPTVAKDGNVLYISDDGLRLRRVNGQVDRLGWPLFYETSDDPEPLLIHYVRIIDGTGAAMTQPCDILVEGGRISKIFSAGQGHTPRNTVTIEGDGRIVIPGMIDAHVHIWDQILLPELLYEGITTAREMGTQMAWTKGFQESIEAGIQAGPRIVLGGFLGASIIQPSLMSSSQPIGNPDGAEAAMRALSLARAFEFDFIKMYSPINPSSGAKFTRMAHEQGFPVSSHSSYPLPLVVSGIDSKEHVGGVGPFVPPRIGGVLQDDIVQLIEKSGMAVVPTLTLCTRGIVAFDGSFAEETGNSPFLNGFRAYTFPQDTGLQRLNHKYLLEGRENVARLHRAGVPLAAGSDIPVYWLPWSLHSELEEFVASGLSPLEAITTASINAARVLHAEKEIGSIEEGKLADLVILDANPLEDIRNTRRIWKVIQGGRVVDRDALLNWAKRESEEVAGIDK